MACIWVCLYLNRVYSQSKLIELVFGVGLFLNSWSELNFKQSLYLGCAYI